MKTRFKNNLILLALVFSANLSFGQGVGINDNSSTPDASAMLDVKSTTKGVLIPRMTTTERSSISSPATGLMVFDNTTLSFWYYDGTNWTEIGQNIVQSPFDTAGGVVKTRSGVVKTNDDFVFGSPQLANNGNASHDTRFFFDKSKGAFRAGKASSSEWNDISVGDYSMAWGYNNVASGNYATAWGVSNTANSAYETVFGRYNTIITPNSRTNWNNSDRLFVIGNGSGYAASSRSDALVVYKNGNMDLSGNLTVGNNIKLNGNWLSGDGGNEGVYVDNSGNVGIGTSTPTNAKLEVNGTAANILLGSFAWLNDVGNINAFVSGTQNISIYASGNIAGNKMIAHSDRRIKTNLSRTNTTEDLATLMSIKVTNYQFVDKSAHGNVTEKKVIAQELKEIYPRAVVDGLTQVVPDIMKFAEVKEGWVALEKHDLKTGEKVRLVHNTGSAEFEVLETKDNAFKVTFVGDEEILVYGRLVHDFHTVDYDAVAMLNVSATQAQQKLIEEQATRIKQLEKELETANQRMDASQKEMQTQLAEIKAMLQMSATK